MVHTFEFDEADFLFVSAKTGLNLEHLLPAVVERVPPPVGDSTGKLRMLLFDCYYDEYRGV